MTRSTDTPTTAVTRESWRAPVMLEFALVSGAVTAIAHWLYFLAAPWIWSQNLAVDPQDTTPWIRMWLKEHDGVEMYALYGLMFVCIMVTAVGARLWHWVENRTTYFGVLAVLAVLTGWYVQAVGFVLPLSTLFESDKGNSVGRVLLVLLVVGACGFLVAVLSRVGKLAWGWVVVSLAVIPVCFMPEQPTSWFDSSYIFSPALRLLRGAHLGETSFQYDLFLSLVAAGWMKLQLDVAKFEILVRISFVVFYLGLFLAAQKVLSNDILPFLLLAGVVMARMYGNIVEASVIIQVTPLRLDWWLILLVLVYRFGPFHWSVGVVSCLMLVLHRTFGLIYAAAYVQLLVALLVFDTANGPREGAMRRFRTLLTTMGKGAFMNVMLMTLGSVVGWYLFSGDHADVAGYYQKIGIGFMPIAQVSFYWYVPVVMGGVFGLCFHLRTILSRQRLISILCLLFLAIGNSVYFFGRSHENNILNISASLLFLLFVFIDLGHEVVLMSARSAAARRRIRRRAIQWGCAIVVITVVAYEGKIVSRASAQLKHAAHGEWVLPSTIDATRDGLLKKVREATGGNAKVYFALWKPDFLYYYYGGYAPVGYFNPFLTWIFRKDLRTFLQGLIDEGYVVVMERSYFQEESSLLRYHGVKDLDRTSVMLLQ